jgi:integrase
MAAGAKPGTWKLRVFLGNDPVSGQPRQKQVTFTGTETAAGKALRRMASEANGANTGTTFGQMLDRWLLQITPTRTPKTVSEYRSKIERHIRPTLGSVALDKLNAEMLDRAYAKWLNDGLSGSTVHHLHAIVSAACKQAVKWGWISTAPTEKASPPPLRLKEITVPEVGMVDTFYRTALDNRDSMLAAAIALAALTGARRGELCALRWSDIDLKRGMLTISRSLSPVEGELIEGDTKTHASRRLSMDPYVMKALQKHQADQRQVAKALGIKMVADPYVLAHDKEHDGSVPTNPDVVSHRFRRLARKLGSTCRLHDLRHFNVTTLIGAGVDVRTVAERVGHARTSMTLDRYAQSLPARDRDAAAVMGHALQLGA